ncbi:DUF4383 domain-containing protein [Haloechinothrix sp. YIM 98757]|uniref:DUF4383 domain-containing protein n=1 Tax=Haloechinothrix aidingensis TaxID=2752311 RepID=A0A838ACW4_9PSEU|nr:DUF4383 domain-containing protein [Haloechinothrix aidingensis]MBA0127119.1 DUF4383 domain-containing protein [Haloechinothrix aidingensis]
MGTSVQSTSTSPNRVLGALFGAVYVLVGLVGFAVTAGTGFAATEGSHLLIFEVNPLHNLVHVGVGALLGLAAWRGARYAAGVNGLVGGIYLLVGVLGLFITSSALNLLALNHADNVLHLASAAVLLGVSLTRR